MQFFLQNVHNWQIWSLNIRENFNKRFLWMCNMQFRERSQKSVAKSEGFSIKVWKWQKIFHTLKLCLPPKIVFGFIDCKIGKHAKTIMPTVQTLLLQVWKKWKKETFIEKDLFYKTNLWDDRKQFWQTPIFFLKSLKLTKWFIELQKKVPKNVPLDSQQAVNRTQLK